MCKSSEIYDNNKKIVQKSDKMLKISVPAGSRFRVETLVQPRFQRNLGRNLGLIKKIAQDYSCAIFSCG